MGNLPAGSIRHFEVALQGIYLLDSHGDPPFIAIALHGYGQTSAVLGAYARRLLGPAPGIVAIEGPHPHYLDSLPGGRVGYNWGTAADWPAAIALHHRILLRVLADLPPKPILLLGFSQPVGLNYRFLSTHPGLVQGALALCGGVPQNWTPTRITTPILHIARSEDEFYPPATATDFEAKLRSYASDVEFQLIPGKHRFPSDGRRLIAPWIQRIFHHEI